MKIDKLKSEREKIMKKWDCIGIDSILDTNNINLYYQKKQSKLNKPSSYSVSNVMTHGKSHKNSFTPTPFTSFVSIGGLLR